MMRFKIKKRTRVILLFIVLIVVLYLQFQKEWKDDLLSKILFYTVSAIGIVTYFFPDIGKFKSQLEKHLHPTTKLNFDTTRPPDTSIQLKQKNTLIKIIKESIAERLEEERSSGFNAIGRETRINCLYTKYDKVSDFLNRKNALPATSVEWKSEEQLTHTIILGKAGCGKSSRLMDAITDLLPEKIKNAEEIIPIYIRLHDFNDQESDAYETFEEWLMFHLQKNYGLRFFWMIKDHHLIPFLDGFDEIADDKKERCFELILNYAANSNIVLSARPEEFENTIRQYLHDKNDEIKNKVNTFNVYEVKDLEPEHVTSILHETGKKHNLDGNNTAMNDRFQALLTTPLLLNLYLKTYVKMTPEELKKLQEMDEKSSIRFLWEVYDKKILAAEFNNPEKFKWVKAMTVQMAHLMKNNSLIIEQSQPHWLPSEAGRNLYYFSSRMVAGIILAIAIGFLLASPFEFIGNGLLCGALVFLLTLHFNKKELKQGIATLPGPGRNATRMFLIILSVAVVSSIYQGFRVQRSDSDMIAGVFSQTDAMAGLIFGLFFGAVFGIRKMRVNSRADILPIDTIHFNFRNAFRWGIKGFFLLGLFSALCGILLLHYFDNSFTRWLNGFIDRPDLTMNKTFFLFLFAFAVGGLMGFVVFFLSNGIDRERDTIEETRKRGYSFSLNHGVKSSLKFAFSYGLICYLLTAGITVPLLYLLNYGEMEAIWKGLSIAAGFSIISFFFLGGFEMLNHWVLRVFLKLYGVAPLQFSSLLNDIRDRRILLKSGASLGFIHPTLQEYFHSVFESEKDLLRNYYSGKSIALLITFLILFSGIMVSYPLYQHFKSGEYWHTPSNFNLLIYEPKKLSDLDSGRIAIHETGKIRIDAQGKVKLGTYLGYIPPCGTNLGFMGFPIGEKYNIVSQFRHGCLLYKKCNYQCDTTWNSLFTQHQGTITPVCIDTISVQAGDTLQFTLNDNEYENNIGRFDIYLEFLRMN